MPTSMDEFKQMLLDSIGQHAQEEEEQQSPMLSPEAGMALMRRLAANYANSLTNGPKFKLGELVTPIAGTIMKKIGKPHIVIEVLPNVQPNFSLGDPSNADYASRLNMRIISIGESRRYAVAHWVESYLFETWKE